MCLLRSLIVCFINLGNKLPNPLTKTNKPFFSGFFLNWECGVVVIESEETE